MTRFAGVLLALSCAAVLPGQPSAQRLRQRFQDPPKSCRPMVRWWWPGGDVTDEELRREVRLLDEANFGGGEIQPFLIGLNPHMSGEARRRVNDYLTPSFYAHVRSALEEARRRGLWLDYTFGSGWPFGGGEAVTPELASLELRYAHQPVWGPARFREKLKFPEAASGMGAMVAKLSGTPEVMPEGWPERLKKREKLVAVIAVRGTQAKVAPRQQMFLRNPEGTVVQTGKLDRDTAVVLTDGVAPDGTLDWNVPEGEWQIFTFMQFPADLRVIGGAGGGPQLVLDHLRKEAFAAHARRVGDSALQHVEPLFGNGLRAIFCDSLEVHAYLFWTDNFAAEFQRRRGYDLIPFLPILKVPGFADPYGAFEGPPIYDIDGVGDLVRRDYWQTVSDVMRDNFYQPFADWAAQHKLLSRVQAHGAPADVLSLYGLSSIPETEDLYNNGRYDFLKMAASAAHVFGRKIASSESFVWMGKAYQTTPEKIKRYADELITAGINEIVYHGFPYEYMDRPEPGWHPFSSPLPFSSHMNHHNPFWPYIPALNAYITRLQYLSQEGTNVAPVALYRSRLSYDAIEPPPPEPEINTRLMEAGYNFDHINTDALLGSRVEGRQLITPGRARYAALILQSEPRIPVELAEKLAGFVKSGLALIFIGGAPQAESGYFEHQRKSERVQALMREALAAGTAARSVASAADAIAELRKSIPPNLRFASGASVPFIEKRVGEVDAFFLRNPDPEPKQLDVQFAAAASPEAWDPWTGRIVPLMEFELQSGSVRVRFELPPYGSKLIVFSPGVNHKPRAAATPATPVPASSIRVGETGWAFHGVGLSPEGKQETRDLELKELADWTKLEPLRHFSGRGAYTTRLTLDPSWVSGKRRIMLDLGDVKDVAEIKVNGKPGPTLLLRPYQADVTGLVRPGENTLEVTVVNTLFNSISARPANPNAFPGLMSGQPALMPSGLIGPVTISARARD